MVNNGQGFTYLGALIIVVILSISLTAASKYWSTVVQREREKELIFRGDKIRRAIESYYKSAPAGRISAYPRSLQSLIKDERYLAIRKHIRKIYLDPMTEDGKWAFVRNSKGGIKGVFSRSKKKPIKAGNFPSEYFDFEKAKTYGDWKFVFLPGT
ncbi:MAG: type II secretion system protein [Desulfobacteraceae bacterium]|nr:type II secretion system protein [Desulfobacteraceae bacterium]MBC2719948.1 type II secretion system protein [Desulfobacteraceae bacterium]